MMFLERSQLFVIETVNNKCLLFGCVYDESPYKFIDFILMNSFKHTIDICLQKNKKNATPVFNFTA